MKHRITTRNRLVAAISLLFAGSAQAFNLGNMMNPSDWMGGNRDRDYDDYGPGYYGGPGPGYGYGGPPGYGGYGAPGYGYGAPGYGYDPAGQGGYYGGAPGYGYGTPGAATAPGYGTVAPGVQVVPGSAYGGTPGYPAAPGAGGVPSYGGAPGAAGAAPYGGQPPYGAAPGFGAQAPQSDPMTAETIERLQERIRLLEEAARQAPPARAPATGSSAWGSSPDYATPAAPVQPYGERPAYQYR